MSVRGGAVAWLALVLALPLASSQPPERLTAAEGSTLELVRERLVARTREVAADGVRRRVRVETGDGEAREFGPGAIWSMEDTAGGGHRTTVLGDEDVHMAIVQF